MLCSGDELRLSVDGEGILILPADTAVGQRAHRPVRGLGAGRGREAEPRRRALPGRAGPRGRGGHRRGARFPSVALREDGQPIGDSLVVAVDDPELCPRFVARRVDGVRVAPSPEHVQRRLLAAGMRPVSNVVDATNFVMLELGKPTHAFDAGAVARDSSGRAALVVRSARDGSGWRRSTTWRGP